MTCQCSFNLDQFIPCLGEDYESFEKTLFKAGVEGICTAGITSILGSANSYGALMNGAAQVLFEKPVEVFLTDVCQLDSESVVTRVLQFTLSLFIGLTLTLGVIALAGYTITTGMTLTLLLSATLSKGAHNYLLNL